MAYPLWQLVDSADDTTVLFDMNDPTGAANPNSVKTFIGDTDFDIGSDEYETGTFDFEDRDGGEVVYARRRLTTTTWSMRAQGTTYANLVAGIGTLGKYLERGGVIKWQATASDAIRFLDFVPSPAPALYRGQMRALFKVLTLLQDPDGAVLTVRRQPGLRAAAVTFGPTVIPNDPADTNGRVMQFTVPGDLPALCSVKVQGDTGSKVKEILIARRSQGAYSTTRVSEWASTTMKTQLSPVGTLNGWLIALSNDTTAVTPDTDASLSTTAETSFATVPTMAKRVRVSRTANLDSLRGDQDVYVRFKAGTGVFIPQLRWGPSLADPCPNVEPEADTIDTAGLSTLTYHDWYMGRISIPQAHMLGGVALEVWARRVSGAGTLRADVMTFVPAGAQDAQSVIEVPAAATEYWLGNQLLTGAGVTNPAGGTSGTVIGTTLRLDTNTDIAGTPPAAGFAWPVGRHVVSFAMQLAPSGATAKIRVRNITDSTSLERTVTGNGTPQTFTIEFDSLSGKSYEPQVDDPVFGQGAVDIYVISHSFVPYISSGEEAHSEVGKGVLHKMDASDNIVSHMELQRGPWPLTCPPGLTGLYFHYVEVPPESGSPSGESKISRDCTVTVSVSARHKT